MDHPNVEATRTSLEALMKGDAATMMAGIADDAVWHVPGNNRFSGDFVGAAAIGDRFQRMMAAGVILKVDEIHDIVGNDEHVVAMVQATVSSGTDSTTQTGVWIFHARDGKATEFWGRPEDQAAIDRVIGS